MWASHLSNMGLECYNLLIICHNFLVQHQLYRSGPSWNLELAFANTFLNWPILCWFMEALLIGVHFT
jgi:hypothetical protein